MKTNRHLTAVCLALFVAVAGLNACRNSDRAQAAREDGKPVVTPAEQEFTMKVTQSNLTEIELGRLVQQKSQNSEVKDYANMLIDDHSAGLKKLTDLMQDKHVPQAKSLSPEARQDIDKLMALSGNDFDREYVNMMVSNHQKALELFRQQSTTAQDSDLKAYVDDTIPTLEKHLQKAQELQSKLFGGAKP